MTNNTIMDVFNKFRGLMDIDMFSELLSYIILLKKIEFTGPEYYEQIWSIQLLHRLYGYSIFEDDLCKYLNNIEKEYGISNGLLVEPFRKIIHRFSDEKGMKLITDVIEAVSRLSFENEKVLAEIYDDFVNYSTMYIGRKGGEYTTNKYLAKLEASLLDVRENDYVYDPFCGSGESIIAACGTRNHIYAREKHPDIVAKAIINMIIHDCKIGEINCGDSIFADDRKYDRVISEPPFTMVYDNAIQDRLRTYMKFLNKDTIAIEKIVSDLSKTGRAVILVPMGVLFRSGKPEEFRKSLVDAGVIDSIIFIPAGVYGYSSINTAIVIIDKTKVNKDVFMVDTSKHWTKKNLKDFTLTDENIDSISKIVKNKEIHKGISLMVENNIIYDNGINLTPTMYIDPYTIDDIEIRNVDELITQQKKYEIEFSNVCKELNEIRFNI